MMTIEEYAVKRRSNPEAAGSALVACAVFTVCLSAIAVIMLGAGRGFNVAACAFVAIPAACFGFVLSEWLLAREVRRERKLRERDRILTELATYYGRTLPPRSLGQKAFEHRILPDEIHTRYVRLSKEGRDA